MAARDAGSGDAAQSESTLADQKTLILKQRADIIEARKLAKRLLELLASLESRTTDPRTKAEKLAAARPSAETQAAMARLMRKHIHGKK